MRLVINKKSTNVKSTEITSLCKGKTIVEADKEDYVEIYKLLSGAQLDHFENFEMKKRTVDSSYFFSAASIH